MGLGERQDISRGAGCRFEVRRVMCTSAYASELTSQITGQL